MPDPIGWAVLVVGALVGSLVGGVAGFGTGIIMLPLVAWVLGLRAAVPVLTVAMTIGNLSRIWWSRGELDRAVVLRFALGAMPATALGTVIYAGAPTEWLAGSSASFSSRRCRSAGSWPRTCSACVFAISPCSARSSVSSRD